MEKQITLNAIYFEALSNFVTHDGLIKNILNMSSFVYSICIFELEI